MKDLFTAETERDQGIERAVSHANRECPAWSEKAYEILRAFIDGYSGQFLGEQVRVYAKIMKLPEPPSQRAWGAIMVRAAREGFIKHVGYAQTTNPRAHAATAHLWQRT